MGVVTRLVFAVLRSPPFVDFLARLSGISGLLPDPVYAGSGVHITGVGGRLTVHIEWPLLGVEVSFALQSGAVCSPIQYYPVLHVPMRRINAPRPADHAADPPALPPAPRSPRSTTVHAHGVVSLPPGLACRAGTHTGHGESARNEYSTT